MNLKDIEEYLHTHIPISDAMGVAVKYADLDEVHLNASYEKNVNHKKTVFGGSLQSLAILSCWTLLWLRMKGLVDSFQIVIAKAEVEYKIPVEEDFVAIAKFPHTEIWDEFTKMILKKSKGRITLSAEIKQSGKIAVAFTGTFVILKS